MHSNWAWNAQRIHTQRISFRIRKLIAQTSKDQGLTARRAIFTFWPFLRWHLCCAAEAFAEDHLGCAADGKLELRKLEMSNDHVLTFPKELNWKLPQ